MLLLLLGYDFMNPCEDSDLPEGYYAYKGEEHDQVRKLRARGTCHMLFTPGAWGGLHTGSTAQKTNPRASPE